MTLYLGEEGEGESPLSGHTDHAGWKDLGWGRGQLFLLQPDGLASLGPSWRRTRGKMFVSLSLCTSNEGCSFQGLLGGLNLRGSFRRWSLLIPGLGDIFLWRLAAQEPDSRQHFPLIMRASA